MPFVCVHSGGYVDIPFLKKKFVVGNVAKDTQNKKVAQKDQQKFHSKKKKKTFWGWEGEYKEMTPINLLSTK